MSDDKAQFSRRQVMKSLAAAAVCPLLSGCEFANIVDGENVDESRFSIGDPDYQKLADVGGTACHSHGSQPMLLVRVDDEQVVAFDRICPHQNLDMGDCGGNPRPATWDADQEVIECRHHNSTFAPDGSFVDGPDPQDTPDIATFPVDFDPQTGRGIVFSG